MYINALNDIIHIVNFDHTLSDTYVLMANPENEIYIDNKPYR